MKNIILIAVTLLTFTGLQAQEGRRERIKSLKIAYLTENLELTPEEAQKFWPVYNTHEEAIYKLRVVEMGALKRNLGSDGLRSITDAEAKNIIDAYQDLEKRIFTLEQGFINDLRTILSPRKVVYLQVLEEKFRRELLRKYQQKRSGNRRK
ncbi:hypothetical protein [Robertkochia sediminum]|uniref:hypothetical protein n=1 Tax=Robertkochia sediminum TaxID=2785326 RepID=UPI0019342F25|nr:hypothetical protein [Robertkochia sediminum]MBL7473118.1 hypothetical protein [Robertkochia sediminum]